VPICAEIWRIRSSTLAGRFIIFDNLFFALDAPFDQIAGVDPGLVNGNPAQLAPNTRHFRNWEFGLFVQDDWKPSRRLTVNQGLRYDLYTRHTELDHLATTFIKGPGRDLIDNITTGAGQIRDASTPYNGGNPLCAHAVGGIEPGTVTTVAWRSTTTPPNVPYAP
jgi:outer membrane receptor protein involved in Fe transport